MNKQPSPYTTGQIVEKTFRNKAGKITGSPELYLRCSIQDYFIKFCESQVCKEEIARYSNKRITVEMEIKEGEWDSCPQDRFPVQSRVGTYVVITAIIQ